MSPHNRHTTSNNSWQSRDVFILKCKKEFISVFWCWCFWCHWVIPVREQFDSFLLLEENIIAAHFTWCLWTPHWMCSVVMFVPVPSLIIPERLNVCSRTSRFTQVCLMSVHSPLYPHYPTLPQSSMYPTMHHSLLLHIRPAVDGRVPLKFMLDSDWILLFMSKHYQHIWFENSSEWDW